MYRHALSDEQWERIEKVLPRREAGPATRLSEREFVDAVICRTKTGIPWRDLPERFGPWKTVAVDAPRRSTRSSMREGRPLHVTVSAGQRHEMTKANELLEHAEGRALIADSGYDADSVVRKVRRRGMKVVIGCNPRRKRGRCRLDRSLYGRRSLVEVFFHRIKRLRAIATRYDTTMLSYLATLSLSVACAWVWLNEGHPLEPPLNTW